VAFFLCPMLRICLGSGSLGQLRVTFTLSSHVWLSGHLTACWLVQLPEPTHLTRVCFVRIAWPRGDLQTWGQTQRWPASQPHPLKSTLEATLLACSSPAFLPPK
jgi:hypothetical protein